MTISSVLSPAYPAGIPRTEGDISTAVSCSPGAMDAFEPYSLHDIKTLIRLLIEVDKDPILRATLFPQTHDRLLSLEQKLAHFNINPNPPSGDRLSQYVENIGRVQQKLALPQGDIDKIKSQALELQHTTEEQLDNIKTQIRDDKLSSKMLLARLNMPVNELRDNLADENPQSASPRAKRSVDTEDEPFTTSTSYADLWAEIVKVIAGIKTNYVDFYGNLLQKYTEMYDEYNKTVQKVAADSTHSGKEANTVKFDEPNLRTHGYKAFNTWVDGTELGSVPDWDNMNSDQREKMVATLEPAFKVAADGKISFNKDTFNSVSQAKITDDGSYTEVSTTRYQAWLASFNSVGSAFQSNMQSFAQRYGQANSTFDNLNKVLSGVISTLGESAREVLKSLS